mmetsp:Transcript_3688/g.4607  ORF Transcript_3688/g.4607 Transcript_3688/m.4607 type:complete len:297 (+) Transcript_3688:143-1033(+)
MGFRRFLVTGANKGIGLGIVRRLLKEVPDSYILLGSRSLEKGKSALASLSAINDEYSSRVEVVTIDVSSNESVTKAAESIKEKFNMEAKPIFGLVNNAGVAESFGPEGMAQTLQVNSYGPYRVVSTFLPLMHSNGRIVNISSASGPMFVAKCDSEVQQFFKDPNVSWEQLTDTMKKCCELAVGDDAKDKLSKAGYGEGQAYGLSKAILNSYTMLLAKQYPNMKINACTPGFIATDLTLKHFGKSDSMKTPDEGAATPLFLLTSENLEGNGRYYGSDAVRSPLDRYRGPGDPPYTGE